jgi:hypothetical protein
MIEIFDVINCYVYPTKNWNEKKLLISKFIDDTKLYRTDEQNYDNDRFANEKSYLKEFCEIFDEELQQFAKELKVTKIKFLDIWKVSYYKGDYQMVHNHGSRGFSGVLYLDYDPKVHTPTYFMSPIMNPVRDINNLVYMKMNEGDIILFPSSILHFTKVNESEKPRSTLAFDLLVEE